MNSDPNKHQTKRAVQSIAVRFFTFIQWCCIGVLILFVGCVAYMVFSGISFFDRPAPSRDGYIAGYFEYFDGTQIEKLDFDWKGAIGGIITVGRAKFKGPVKIRQIMVEERGKDGKISIGTYDPAKMTEEEVWEVKHQWTVITDGKMPPWLDFPFNRKMRTIEETYEEIRDVRPRSYRAWYIDDAQDVVYVFGSCG